MIEIMLSITALSAAIFAFIIHRKLMKAYKKIDAMELQMIEQHIDSQLQIKDGIYKSVSRALSISLDRKKYLRQQLVQAIMEQHNNNGKSISVINLMYQMDKVAETANERAWLNMQIGRCVFGISICEPRKRMEKLSNN